MYGRHAWASVQGATFKPVGQHVLAQLMCVGDWDRVMGGGPWQFRGFAVVIDEYDGFTSVDEYKLDHIPVWARVMGVLKGLMKKKELQGKNAKKRLESLHLK